MTEEERQRAEDIRRGRPVPYIIVGFFVTFVLLLLSFVYIAVRYPPSETTQEAYQKGLRYNQILEKSDRGRALGWQVAARLDQGVLNYNLMDAQNVPINDAVVKAWFVHPGDSKLDRHFDLINDGSGHYSTKADVGVAHWNIHITAARGENQIQTKIDAEVE
jgi:nitrogen fixation protein FixH